MIVVKLQGGLGNQMFQYATGRSLAFKWKKKLLLDITSYSDNNGDTPREYELEVFNINASIANAQTIHKFHIPDLFDKLCRKLGLPYKRIYNEHCFYYEENLLEFAPPFLARGFFQTEKYFNNIRNILLKEFTVELPLLNAYQALLNEILTLNSVSIHVRRGDYVTSSSTNAFHGTCSLDYYKRAILMIQTKVSVDRFFVFSDDAKWARENLIIDERFKVLSNDSMEYYPVWLDMILMSKCKHNIIANSSYSWWGAWLNTNQSKIVIAPSIWFANEEQNIQTFDLIPKEWHRI